MAVADVFQALVQTRPYRAGLSPDQVMDIVHEHADRGALDPAVVARLDADLEAFWALATPAVTSDPEAASPGQ